MSQFSHCTVINKKPCNCHSKFLPPKFISFLTVKIGLPSFLDLGCGRNSALNFFELSNQALYCGVDSKSHVLFLAIFKLLINSQNTRKIFSLKKEFRNKNCLVYLQKLSYLPQEGARFCFEPARVDSVAVKTKQHQTWKISIFSPESKRIVS